MSRAGPQAVVRLLWQKELPRSRRLWFEDAYFAYVSGRCLFRHGIASGELTWSQQLPLRLRDYSPFGRRVIPPLPEWRLVYADAQRILVALSLGYGFGTSLLSRLRAFRQETGAVVWAAPEGTVGDEYGFWIDPQRDLIQWHSARDFGEERVLDAITGEFTRPPAEGVCFRPLMLRNFRADTSPYAMIVEEGLPYLVRRDSGEFRVRLADAPRPRQHWDLQAYRRRIRYLFAVGDEPTGVLASLYIGPRYLLLATSTEEGLCIEALEPRAGRQLAKLVLPEQVREPSIDEWIDHVVYVSAYTPSERVLAAIRVRVS